MAAIGVIGISWGLLALPQSQTVDGLRNVESRLLASEFFSQTALTSIIDSAAEAHLSSCASHAQRAMLLIEILLADASLRAGLVKDFDQHVSSLERRGKQVLGCTPRDSFAWLLMFNLEMLHGRLNEHSLDLLTTSYRMSPHEAWISIRRNPVAVSVLMVAGEPLRQQILLEFGHLLRDGFFDDAARSYARGAKQAQELLANEVEKLDLQQKAAFQAALRKVPA